MYRFLWDILLCLCVDMLCKKTGVCKEQEKNNPSQHIHFSSRNNPRSNSPCSPTSKFNTQIMWCMRSIANRRLQTVVARIVLLPADIRVYFAALNLLRVQTRTSTCTFWNQNNLTVDSKVCKGFRNLSSYCSVSTDVLCTDIPP